eukprot:SAG25_NODE_4734_length_759_cov_0.934848_1_plen_120_part_10
MSSKTVTSTLPSSQSLTLKREADLKAVGGRGAHCPRRVAAAMHAATITPIHYDMTQKIGCRERAVTLTYLLVEPIESSASVCLFIATELCASRLLLPIGRLPVLVLLVAAVVVHLAVDHK